MGTWSIVEGDGASITQDGKVTIPAGYNKTYKIKYQSSDGGCACFHTITQSAPGPGPEPTECTSWSSWSSWSVDDLPCRGGDSSATASRTRYCLTNPSDIDTEYKPVSFSTTSCNSGNRQLIYDSGGITVYQAGGCTCGGPGPEPDICTCYKTSTATAATADWDDTSATVTWAYTARTIHSDGTYTDSSQSTSSTTVTFSQNESQSQVTRSGSITWTGHNHCNGSNTDCDGTKSVSWKVEQNGKGGGGGCDCSLAESSASFTSAGGSKTITVNGASSCSGWQATSSKSWCTPDYRSGKLTITVGEYTDTTTDRSATVTLKAESGSKTCGTVSVTQSKKSGSCTISYTSTGKTGHASFSYGGSTKTSSSGSFTASGTGGTITASADSEYYVQPSSADVPCGGSKRFDIYKNVACTVYGGNTGSSVSVDFHPNAAPNASITFSVDYETTSGTRQTYTEQGQTISGGQNRFTVTIPSSYHPKRIINSTFSIVSKSFASSGGQSTIDSSTYTRYYF